MGRPRDQDHLQVDPFPKEEARSHCGPVDVEGALAPPEHDDGPSVRTQVQFLHPFLGHRVAVRVHAKDLLPHRVARHDQT